MEFPFVDEERLKEETLTQSQLLKYNFLKRINQELEKGSIQDITDITFAYRRYIMSLTDNIMIFGDNKEK